MWRYLLLEKMVGVYIKGWGYLLIVDDDPLCFSSDRSNRRRYS